MSDDATETASHTRDDEREEAPGEVTDADQRPAVERGAESFLAIESALTPGDPAAFVRGRAVDVSRIPATDVPESYPVEIPTDSALAVHVEIDDQSRDVIYFPWDGTASDDRLGRLLALHEIPPERFGDLHGRSIALSREDGHYVPRLPAEPPRGSPLGVYGVGAGLAVNLLLPLAGALGVGGLLATPLVVALWLVLNFLVLPVGTYLDAWYLRTRTDWAGGPLFWASLALIPGVNVLSSVLYLFARLQATHLADV